GQDGPGVPDLRRRLEGLPHGQRTDAVLEVVRAHTAAVLGYGPEEPLEDRRPFKELGFDSVTGVELRNRLNAETGLRLPATLVFEHPTPTALAGHVLAELGVGAAAEAQRPVDVDALEAAATALDASALAPADTDRLSAVSRVLQEILARAGDRQAPPEEPHEAPQALDDASDDELFQFIDEKFGL
ncbi:phosphopantetheine-binding protein, partial [Streptomyces europaeiscabiei]|uniref:phosphopantetheine-binding protein n=1 Tax=Streptomyces europaeiscabiei TaxID=146819 RepID=UPI00099E4D94